MLTSPSSYCTELSAQYYESANRIAMSEDVKIIRFNLHEKILYVLNFINWLAFSVYYGIDVLVILSSIPWLINKFLLNFV